MCNYGKYLASNCCSPWCFRVHNTAVTMARCLLLLFLSLGQLGSTEHSIKANHKTRPRLVWASSLSRLCSSLELVCLGNRKEGRRLEGSKVKVSDAASTFDTSPQIAATSQPQCISNGSRLGQSSNSGARLLTMSSTAPTRMPLQPWFADWETSFFFKNDLSFLILGIDLRGYWVLWELDETAIAILSENPRQSVSACWLCWVS